MLLASYRNWLRVVAAHMTVPDKAEDLAQEGWIAMWRASQDYDGSSPLDYWLKFKARGRMLMVVRNWQTSPNIPTDELADVWDALKVELPEIEMAYHEGQVAKALDCLTPREREYVVARFWGGLNYPELTEYFGYPPQGLWRTAKLKLTQKLSDLRSTVGASTKS